MHLGEGGAEGHLLPLLSPSPLEIDNRYDYVILIQLGLPASHVSWKPNLAPPREDISKHSTEEKNDELQIDN